MTTLAGTGQRRRIEIGGENYYIIVTRGENGPHVCATCPRENAPERREIRAVVERICKAITEMLRSNAEVSGGGAFPPSA